MRSMNFVVLGDTSIADELGKKGAVTDITMYDRKLSDKIFTFVVPSTFPEKVQSLIQSIALCEHAILNVKTIDKDLGETIVALDNAGMKNGFIVANGFDEDLKTFAKGTVLENYEFLSLDEVKQKIETIEPEPSEGDMKVFIDSAFEVKGIGTVALGVVRRGTIKKHDEIEIFPEKVTATVKSIQMHDDDVDQTNAFGRVGLALRGTSSDLFGKGSVAGVKDSIKTSKELKIGFRKSKFYKEEINESSSYHLCLGLQINPVKVKLDGDNLIINSDKDFAFETGERTILIDLNSKSVRIVGNGIIL